MVPRAAIAHAWWGYPRDYLAALRAARELKSQASEQGTHALWAWRRDGLSHETRCSAQSGEVYVLEHASRAQLSEWELVREWGRIGQAGQVRHTLYAEQEGVAAAFERDCPPGSGAAMRSRQRRIIGRFLPGGTPAPGEGGCASGKALRGDRDGAQRKRSEGSWAEAPCRA